MNRTRMVWLAVAACLCGPALADSQTFSGDVGGGAPRFHRPTVPHGDAMSLAGTAVAYEAAGFRVAVSGSYSLSSVAAGYGAVILLYADSFDPGHPLEHFVAGAYADSQRGSIFQALEQGRRYVIVNTGDLNVSAGVFESTIAGPGTVTLETRSAPPARPGRPVG